MTNRTKWIIRLAFLLLFIVLMVLKLPQIWLAIYMLGVIITPFFGRLYCAYVCPMATVMDPVDRVSKHLGLQRPKERTKRSSYVVPIIMLVVSLALMIAGKRLFSKQIPILPIMLALSAVMTLFFPAHFWHNVFCPFSVALRLASRNPMRSYRIDKSICKGTRRCTKVCPSYAITMVDDGKKAEMDVSLCHQCGSCARICPVSAIGYQSKHS